MLIQYFATNSNFLIPISLQLDGLYIPLAFFLFLDWRLDLWMPVQGTWNQNYVYLGIPVQRTRNQNYVCLVRDTCLGDTEPELFMFKDTCLGDPEPELCLFSQGYLFRGPGTRITFVQLGIPVQGTQNQNYVCLVRDTCLGDPEPEL